MTSNSKPGNTIKVNTTTAASGQAPVWRSNSGTCEQIGRRGAPARHRDAGDRQHERQGKQGQPDASTRERQRQSVPLPVAKQRVATAADRQAPIGHFGQPLQQAAITTLAESVEAFVHDVPPCKERTPILLGALRTMRSARTPSFFPSRSSGAKRHGAEWKASLAERLGSDDVEHPIDLG
jgi:hypothetical protein